MLKTTSSDFSWFWTLYWVGIGNSISLLKGKKCFFQTSVVTHRLHMAFAKCQRTTIILTGNLKKTVTFWVRYFFVVKLSCVCSVIDHRWRQNVVRTEKWHTRRNRVCHWCSYHILTSSVIYYWIRRTATWNLFVLYNNEKPFLFQNIST